MKLHHHFLIATALFTLPGCAEKPADLNRKDGVRDALDTRPNEKIRDAGEDVEDGVKNGGKDIKDSVR